MLHPLSDMTTMTLNGRCYRVPTTAPMSSSRSTHAHSAAALQGAEDDALYEDEMGDCSHLDIKQVDGSFRLEMHLDKAFYKYLIGKGGSTKKKLETETGGSVHIPGPKDTKEVIALRGSTSQIVRSLHTRIEILVDSALENPSMQYTHFVCIPLSVDNPELVTNFEKFRNKVLSLDTSRDAKIEKSVFISSHQLHLTICMLKLYGDARVQLATEIMQTLDGLNGNNPLEVELSGLEYMNDDPSAVDVLFCKIKDADGKIQALCEGISQAFNNAGLLLDKDNRKVKMHATVINTRYRTSQNEDTVVATAMGSRGSSHQRHPERESVDCRAVLNRFGDMKLGVAKVNSLHLSQRGQNDSNGFYKCISALQL